MNEELLSAEQVADRLGLHVRTVRGYVRDGRLPAVKIGKQYRIARSDVDAFTGTSTPPPRQQRHVEFSGVVEMHAISPHSASRISTLLTTALAGDRGGDRGGEPVRCNTVYDEQRGLLKIMVFGDLAAATDVLGLVRALSEETGL